jgi:glycosyltransferase involved in cell wall biosynthesis
MYALQTAVMKGQGGVFTSLFHYARMFDAVGVDSACLYRGPGAQRLREGGVRVVDAPASLTSPFFPVSFDRLSLTKAIHKAGGGQSPDFAMVHSDLALKSVRRMFPKAVIMTRCHSDKTKHKRDADIVVTLNPEQHARVTRELEGSRARTFLLGHPFMMDPPPSAAFGDGPLRVNLAARFISDKDPMTFVLAASMMHANPKPEFRFIGAGPLEADMKRALDSMGVRATFPGWKPSPLEDFTHNDVLVLPSLWEGLPWLLLEAQARGIPTVASNIPGNAYALADGAYGDLFPKGDAAALALLLDNAVANLDGLRAKAERGRKDLPGRFGPRAFWNGLQDAMRAVRETEPAHV